MIRDCTPDISGGGCSLFLHRLARSRHRVLHTQGGLMPLAQGIAPTLHYKGHAFFHCRGRGI
jgi:hypothetical protein